MGVSGSPSTTCHVRLQEIEEICTAAVKEEMIEKKLSAITARWSSAVFTFAEYKTRGPVVLQVVVTKFKPKRRGAHSSSAF